MNTLYLFINTQCSERLGQVLLVAWTHPELHRLQRLTEWKRGHTCGFPEGAVPSHSGRVQEPRGRHTAVTPGFVPVTAELAAFETTITGRIWFYIPHYLPFKRGPNSLICHVKYLSQKYNCIILEIAEYDVWTVTWLLGLWEWLHFLPQTAAGGNCLCWMNHPLEHLLGFYIQFLLLWRQHRPHSFHSSINSNDSS